MVRSASTRWLTGALGTASWRGLGYLLLGIPTSGAAFAVALTAVIAGSLLGITYVGLVAAPVLIGLVRAVASVERRRCALVLPAAPATPYARLTGLNWMRRLRLRLRDPATWRDLAWLLLSAPVAIGCATVAVCLWSVVLALATMPVWYRFLPDHRAVLFESNGVAHGVVDSLSTALPWALVGLPLVWVAGWACRGLAVGQARLAAALLVPTDAARLRDRVATLSATRAAAVDEQARELRQIERDLHDGAQARLVALGADLGLAGEAFDTDPEAARELVERARDGIGLALTELRDLVRGIGPPILADRGLAAALDAVAAHSPIPVSIAVDLPDRPPPAVETAAYFVLCESIANAAKHSAGSLITVHVRRRRDRCVLTVHDDGRGGADPNSPGLRGIADRVGALDGTLTTDSPPGGPTVIRAELPCAW
jgi:signal transduction histidine kinase